MLLVAAALIAGAVVVRVWLAATGGYSGVPLSVPLRVASAVALFTGLLLAALAVAWPMRTALNQGRRLGTPTKKGQEDT